MKIRQLTIALITTLIVFSASSAAAQLVTLVKATELTPSNIIFPQSMNGMMTYKPCAEKCDEEYERARLTADTQYTVNGRGVKFEDFKRDLANFRSSKDSYALVSVDTKTKTVVSIQIEG